MNLIQLFGAIELGLLYGLVALAIYLTFRVINFPDLTVDGSFPLGAAVYAALIVKGEFFNIPVGPLMATALAIMAGALAGFVTGFLHVRLKILGLLAGILTMTALYSVNLRIMGKPNIALSNEASLFGDPQYVIWVLLLIVLGFVFLLQRFLKSQYGLALRGTGINPRVSPSYGVNTDHMTLVGLVISNGLVALAGALYAQFQGFADISMGTGTLIYGLAAVIVGETLITSNYLSLILISTVLGSILYRIAIAFALNIHEFGLQTYDLNLITAGLVVVALLFPRIKQKIKTWGRRAS